MAIQNDKKVDRYQQLTEALRNAAEAALEFGNADDGGTCNFDSPTVDFHALHMSKKKAEQAIAKAGLRCFDWRLFGTTQLVICGMSHGQGNRNTLMAEAAHKSLVEQGIPSGMYYQMD